jgi:hypothetical protein
MPKTEALPVEKLNLDLRNFRMVPQTSEKNAIHGMIAVKADWLWALMESLLAEDGYLPTENILILRDGDKLVVKEGNRRIAALKLIHGYIKRGPFRIPEHIERMITALSPGWIANNKLVPCTIYDQKDSAKVDRIVNLAHGKGEKAGRDKWEAIARARHDRDIKELNVPALDFLEKYLKEGSNITDFQRERWGGDVPLHGARRGGEKDCTPLQADVARVSRCISEKDQGENRAGKHPLRHWCGKDHIRYDPLPKWAR